MITDMKRKDRTELWRLLEILQNVINGDDTDVQNACERIKDELRGRV